MADTDMQLRQGETWQELTKELPLAEGSSHLKFLGLDEVELSFNLTEKRPGFLKRIMIFLKLAKPETTKTFKIMPLKKSQYNMKISITREANKNYKATATPDTIKETDRLQY